MLFYIFLLIIFVVGIIDCIIKHRDIIIIVYFFVVIVACVVLIKYDTIDNALNRYYIAVGDEEEKEVSNLIINDGLIYYTYDNKNYIVDIRNVKIRKEKRKSE